MESLVECLQSQCSPSFGFGSRRSSLPAPAVGVHDAWQAPLGAGAGLLVAGINGFRGEGRAYSDCDERVVELIAQGTDGCLDWFGEEVRESKGVRGIALDDRSIAGSSGRKRWADAVEAQVDPRRKEAEPREEHGRLSAQRNARYGVGEEENGGEVLDAHADEALGDCDGMLRDELLEGDEEAGLDRNAAGDGGGAVRVSKWPSVRLPQTHRVFSFLERT